jgi:hypothetical protein
MNLRRALFIWAMVLTTTIGLGLPISTWASHRWSCWKYANYSINWYNGGTGDYYNIYNEEAKTDSNAWSPYTDLVLNTVSASGTTDHANAYNGYYGSTGWLGLAEILNSNGCTVLNGRARLNQTYLDNGSYSRTNKKHVACQEVGHLFGLHHNTSSTTTCMNDQILSAPHPNAHDQNLINSIY